MELATVSFDGNYVGREVRWRHVYGFTQGKKAGNGVKRDDEVPV